MTTDNFTDKLRESVLHTLPIIATFFAPALWIAVLVVLFVLVDTRLGIKASKNEGKQFTSNRFSDVFAKLIGYGVFICVGLIVRLITGWEYSVWLSAIIPIYTEIKSIDENQKRMGKKGIVTEAEEVYKFALSIKKKKDELR